MLWGQGENMLIIKIKKIYSRKVLNQLISHLFRGIIAFNYISLKNHEHFFDENMICLISEYFHLLHSNISTSLIGQ